MAEMYTRQVLLPGNHELQMISMMVGMFGFPPEHLLSRMLPSARAAIIDSLRPLARVRSLAEVVPQASPEAIKLMSDILLYGNPVPLCCLSSTRLTRSLYRQTGTRDYPLQTRCCTRTWRISTTTARSQPTHTP